MSKQFIEFILKNEEHLKWVKELQKLWEEYVDYHINDIEITANGIYVRDSQIHDTQYISDEFQKLIEENYFFDPDCDPYYVIEEGLFILGVVSVVPPLQRLELTLGVMRTVIGVAI